VTVSVSSGCPWTAVSNASWITVTSGSSGSGPGVVHYFLSVNPSTTTHRIGTITIAGQTFTVIQGWSDYYWTCREGPRRVSPRSQSFSTTGGTGSVEVSMLPGCAWAVNMDRTFNPQCGGEHAARLCLGGEYG